MPELAPMSQPEADLLRARLQVEASNARVLLGFHCVCFLACGALLLARNTAALFLSAVVAASGIGWFVFMLRLYLLPPEPRARQWVPKSISEAVKEGQEVVLRYFPASKLIAGVGA